MAVYREFDQAALDAQYNCRGMVPDFDDQIAYWISQSELAQQKLNPDLEIAYGPDDSDRLDIYPAADPDAPIMVFIHGGYWRAQDKREHAFPALGFVPAGITLISINYALAPAVRLTDIVRQCRAALVWVHRNASSFGGDRSRIHVCGHSAGGHLTAMMLATDWTDQASGLPADMVKGGCPISGLYDLEPIRLSYLNADLHLDQPEAAAISPVLAEPRGANWMIVTAGGLESAEFHRQQSGLVDKWRASGLAIEIVESPGMHHFNVVLQLGDPGSPLLSAVCSRIL
jgi:arylformamidase